MKSERTNAVVKFAAGAVLLVAAYRAGVLSRSLLLTQLTAEAERLRLEALSGRDDAEMASFLVRASLESAVSEAWLAHLTARQAELSGAVPRRDAAPPDRLRALRDRLREDSDQHQRRLATLRAAVRERARRRSGT